MVRAATTCLSIVSMAAACHVAKGGPPVHFDPLPTILTIADLGPAYEVASITDVEAADLDRDGMTDLAVVWYATDNDVPSASMRVLSRFYGTPSGAFVRAPDINLYYYNVALPSLSIFRNGTAELAIGDFDGDGDLDIAATTFFGDEIRFLENTGSQQFTVRSKYMFGVNTDGNSVSPTEATTADFDGDGRADLVYVVDPIQRIDTNSPIHFWRTGGAMTSMYRIPWEGISDDYTTWTWGLAVADFDNDNRPDLCFAAATDPTEPIGPALVFWHNLNVSTRRFDAFTAAPGFVCSDVGALRSPAWCGPGVIVSDLDGTTIEIWGPSCASGFDFERHAVIDGFAGCAINRGMAILADDLNGDGEPDVVTRQKVGDPACRHIDIALGSSEQTWTLLDPPPIDSTGFSDPAFNEILRPRNLAVTDLFGSRLPEIIAAFGPTVRGPNPPPGLGALEVAIWSNRCLGDLTSDGQTDLNDLTFLLTAMGCQGADGGYRPDADLDRDGCVGLSDLALLLTSFGCICCP